MFIFNNKEYKYFKHQYNDTSFNERAIEIPIIKEVFKRYKSNSILEVGNVLKHYIKSNHTVVDLGEKSKGVINEDIRTFVSAKKYDLVVSISTIEHISEEEEDLIIVYNNLKSMNTFFGQLIITFPLGFNSGLDKLLNDGFFNKYTIMKKSIDLWESNIWEESSKPDKFDSLNNIMTNGKTSIITRKHAIYICIVNGG